MLESNPWNFCWPSPKIHTKVQVTLRKAGSILHWGKINSKHHVVHILLLLFNHSVVSDSLWPHGLQHTRLPCPSLSPRVCSNSYSSSRWCHPAILSSVVPISSCLQSFPLSGSFPMSQLFISSGQNIGASASASVIPVNIQGWFPLGLTDLIFLLSKGPSRVFSSTTVQKHQFMSTQSSLWSNSHICMWLLKKIMALTIWTWLLSAKVRAEIDHRRLLWNSRQNTVVDLGSSHWN